MKATPENIASLSAVAEDKARQTRTTQHVVIYGAPIASADTGDLGVHSDRFIHERGEQNFDIVYTATDGGRARPNANVY